MGALLSHTGRFSGGSHGFIIGHITPEAQVGGPIGVVEDGDIIEINAETRVIRVDISDEEVRPKQAHCSKPAAMTCAAVCDVICCSSNIRNVGNMPSLLFFVLTL